MNEKLPPCKYNEFTKEKINNYTQYTKQEQFNFVYELLESEGINNHE